MTWQRSSAPLVKQFPSRYIPPMIMADFSERLNSAIKSAGKMYDDLPPPIPPEAIEAEIERNAEDMRQRLARANAGHARSSEAIGRFQNRRRPRNAQRNWNPRIMSARYAGTCSETGRNFSEGASILWVPNDRQCFIEDSETYQDFLTSQREARA